ncbi:MAG TPA: ABC transporter ATP-binding protein [Candidatus Acidoferrales bacterium]|nr:ABC transporter ATP-binding protein [Candidatus Acidoferrales bacterium]
MNDSVIRVEGIGKRYPVGGRERYVALRDVLANVVRLRGRKKQPKDFVWAVRDVSFKVKRGEVVGLIGRNGAGKTTLLKLLARITRPTAGSAEIHGRIGSLLEVGTGFHPELTGRENIYLSGAILGMSKKEIDRKYEDIVAFAEVERFIDTPLKHFSSGMQMRLAFAVAAHLEPEILLVDEVLAVGDIAFQKKCLGKMQEVSQSGRTIVFVSHQMNQIRRLCERVIWLDGGEIRQSGTTPAVLGAYEAALSSGDWAREERTALAKVKARFLKWEIVKPRAEQPNLLSSPGPLTIQFQLQVNRPIHMGHHGISLYNSEGQLMWAWAANNLELAPDMHELRYTFPMLPLRSGTYSWHVSLYDEDGLVDQWQCVPEMAISTESHQHFDDRWNGILNVPCRFAVEREEAIA